ncbi:MAG: methionine--tRNA ligase [Oscillospiraceae bacterium]|nr:methionine--tRNA ligase [Oscillospiraceae bacterium]
MSKGKYYLSTAIAYASGKPHIGNTYEIVLADAICRFKRLEGYDVYFQTGTDEHGQKIQEKAEKAGVTPQQYVDSTSAEIKRIWDVMNTSYDRFVRTTDPMHEKKIQEIFEKFLKTGDIYKSKYEGWYCTPCESFWTESQLVDGKCPDCGREVKWAEEEAYFFRLSKYTELIMKYIEEHPEFIQPEARKNEMVNNFLRPGLQDLCVSRTSFNWGIPVSSDPKHVVYVWLDALSNYITFPGYEPEGEDSDFYKKYWPADVHLIGKDIVRFHTLYWPAFLMALGEPLPKQVFGHPWLLTGSGKMSKSLGNVLYADDLVELYGVDAVRYYVLHEIPFASDGTLTHDLMMERINSDLANILGNLVNRTVSMTHKYLGGTLRKRAPEGEFDADLIALAKSTAERVQSRMESLHVADAIDEIFALLRRANKYVDETQPWVLGRDEAHRERLEAVLYNLCETIRIAGGLLKPFLPGTAEKIERQLRLDASDWEALSEFGVIEDGHAVGEAEILFQRLDIPKKTAEVEAFYAEKYAPKVESDPVLPDVTIDDFSKCDMRVCKVLTCENVKKSEKLLKFTLDDGSGKPRQILSGIAKFYKPEELVGKTVVAILNLPPRKMMGQESCGMLISAVKIENGEEKLNLLMLDDSIPAGARLG